jgi:hypothetical protein
VRRFFDAAVSDGTITRWLPAAQGEPALWNMTHEDGDQEDLEAHEVRAAMRAYKLGLQHDDGADGEGAEGASAMEDEDEEVEVADTSADGDVEHVLAEQEAPACLSAVAQFAGVSAVRAHLSALNGLGSSALSHFSLDEDTVTFKVRTSFVRGTVSVLLFESSSYPRTGGLAYVEGCDELLQAVESIAEPLSDRASLDNCVRLLCRALGGPPELSELLATLPVSGGSGGGASCSGAAGSSSLMMGQDDDDASPMDVGDDVGGNDDDEDVSDGADDDDDDDDDDLQANLDYDFARGAELENSLLRLRHQWEVKDQRRREERAERAHEEEEAAADAALKATASAVGRRKRERKEGATSAADPAHRQETSKMSGSSSVATSKMSGSSSVASGKSPVGKLPNDEAELKCFKGVLTQLFKHKEVDQFLEPVDWQGLGLDDYPEVVTHPMDLNAVQMDLNAVQARLEGAWTEEDERLEEAARASRPAGRLTASELQRRLQAEQLELELHTQLLHSERELLELERRFGSATATAGGLALSWAVVREAGTAIELPSDREQVEELIELQLQLQREVIGIPRPSVPALAAVDAIIASGFRGGMAPPLDGATSARDGATSARDGATSARDGAPARLESAAAAQAAVRALASAVQAMGDVPSGTPADACACSVGSSSHASASSAPLEAIAAAAAATTAAAADASAPVPPVARYDAQPSAPVPLEPLAAPTTALAPMDGVATVAEGLRRMIAPWHGVGLDHEGESLISSADLAAGSTPLKPVMEAPNRAPARYSVPVQPNTAPGQSFLARVGVPLQEYVIKERKEKAPKAEKKKKEKPPVDEMTRFWTKAERDRALKAASNLGISDLERLAHALGRPAPVARSFADGLLVSLLGALEAPQAAASALKELTDMTLRRSFWGFEATPDTTPSPPPLPAVKAVAADEAAAGEAAAATEAAREAAAPKTTAPTTASTTAPSLVWALLPEDVKFDEALRKGAVRTLQRLLWMRTLYELRVPAAEAAAPAVAVAPAEGTPADAADATENTETAAIHGAAPPPPAAALAVPLVELALPEAFTKQLGGGTVDGKGTSSGTLPARWWGVAHDRALLQYTATHGLHLDESVWEGLASTVAFAAPPPASNDPMSGGSSEPSSSSAPCWAPRGSSEPSSSSAPLPAALGAQHGATPPATLKQALTRRDALLRQLQAIVYGAPGKRDAVNKPPPSA